MKSHIIGVIIGLTLAILALFSINFFIAQEHLIEEEIVIHKNTQEVNNFLQIATVCQILKCMAKILLIIIFILTINSCKTR